MFSRIVYDFCVEMFRSRFSHPLSALAWWACALLIVGSAFFYYPKWRQSKTEATLSWDVSGYYFYLPAFLIYGDARELAWRDSILQKYHPTPDLQQAFRHEPSGHYVMKYPVGQALQMLPWFTVGHLLAAPLGYAADGFSRPYQAAISWGSLFVALLGLWYLRKALLYYYQDAVVAATLLCIVWGTNYLNYTAFDGAMTHNWLFTLYGLIIYHTIRYYDQPSLMRAAGIGLMVGWAVITRPTELWTAFIPLLWGWDSWAKRWRHFNEHKTHLAVAATVFAAMVSLQMLYWRYAGGSWVIYSYEEQGFNWLKPHILDGLVSFKAGWLIYSPMMILSIVGLWHLWRQHKPVAIAVLCLVLPIMYVTWAWDIWWYGGSLGQRAMVQSYPLWAFGLAAWWHWILTYTSDVRVRREFTSPWAVVRHTMRPSKWLVQAGAVLLAGFFVWHNLWWTHQAHLGGLFLTEQMNKYYWLAVWGRDDISRDALKLLDTKDEHYARPASPALRRIHLEDFERDTSAKSTTDAPINGTRSLRLDERNQWSAEITAIHSRPAQHSDRPKWIRATCTFRCDDKEWESWRMTQFIVRAFDRDRKLTERLIRLQRHVDGNERKTISFDTRLPNTGQLDRVVVVFWNAESRKTVRIDDVTVEVF
jgi:hypothetical protein